MGLYLFSNPKNETEIVEVVMSIHDNHQYIKDGVVWDRIWTKPTASVSSISKIDPFNSKSFVETTGKKSGNLGDLQDLSEELSQKLEKKMGQDPIKIAANERYKKTHHGKDSPEFRKKKLKESLKNTSFEWSD